MACVTIILIIPYLLCWLTVIRFWILNRRLCNSWIFKINIFYAVWLFKHQPAAVWNKGLYVSLNSWTNLQILQKDFDIWPTLEFRLSSYNLHVQTSMNMYKSFRWFGWYVQCLQNSDKTSVTYHVLILKVPQWRSHI